ncbi:YihY/virulence factor BrkB family protein [Mucilaginibacter daejeonensis]|uniref:YihY/virulence factor BrkB family protein n=1 Tax=Mucilaginibacter daejeonensis TaxID=398049 RepID=UPI001D174837|nr:YihY/virulence factor BrkB family protein [Mucilaginibacter daejeonensis]UEG51652.1 YihY/virulence factor BrkB family protein [Mucilaginibacter daejeonensis]
MTWLHRFLLKTSLYRAFLEWTKSVILPGFRPLPLYTIAVFFIGELRKSALINRASSLAFNFMLAFFPATIFLFTLIPFVPISHFQDTLLHLIEVILPHNAYLAFESTMKDIIKNQNGKLLSIGFLSALYFASNGVYNLMQAFNKSSLVLEDRTWVKRRLISVALTIVISFSLLFAIAILIAGQALLKFLQSHMFQSWHFWLLLISLSRWIIVILIFFVVVSTLYRYGPAHKRRWKFSSPGSILATALAVTTSLGFSYYINNFSSYNKVYGSIGTLLVMMIYMQLNSLIILIGFELNASVDLSKRSIKIIKPRFNTFRTPRQRSSQ